LLARTLRVPYELIAGPCDSGIVQSTSISHDDEATVEEAADFYADFPARVERELEALAPRGVSLVVGDIAPIAFEVASRLGVPGVAIGNFTWDWIYEQHPGFLDRTGDLLETIRHAYTKATVALELPFAGGFEVFPKVEPLPLVARRPTHDRATTRAHFGLPAEGRVALLSFGGYGLPSLNLATVDCRNTWTIVTTDRVSRASSTPLPHVRMIPEEAFLSSDFRYEDVVASVDAVMTKPGYGIVSEAIAAERPLLYTSRGVFREYDLFVREMPRYLRARFIPQEDLFAGQWLAALEALLLQSDPPEHLRPDGADYAARRLLELARLGD
jgi:L-arabinokinase